MTLVRLYGRHFRNLEELSWEPSSGSHLLLGDNGAGKTSLLEAIYVLATTRSFRATRLTECRRHGEGEFALNGEVHGDRRTEIAVASSPEGTSRRVNGATSSLSEHLAVLPIVSWTDDDTEWISGSPAARRRLIDRGVVGVRPGALEILGRYRRALEQKRELLARRQPNLGPWNEVLSTAADELIAARRSHVEALRAELDRILSESELALPPITLDYRPSPAEGGHGVETTLAAIDAVQSTEYERGAPIVGPHRDELDIRWDGNPARKVASVGERKLLGLAITAARAHLLEASGRSPVLLLDDLDAALDSRRLTGIWEFFRGFSQLFVTSNRASVWKPFSIGTSWKISCGKLALDGSF